jgi:hypothetical protein
MSQSNSELQRLVQSKLKAYKFKDQIQSLYALGKSDSDISLDLDIPEAQIVAQREAMGLPNRFTQGICYSAEDDDTIVTLRDEKYLRWAEISRKLSRGHTSLNIQLRYRYLDGLRTRRNKNGAPTQRECKGCAQDFLSEGNHVRYCDKCRDSDLRHVDHYLVTHTNSILD